MPDVMTTERQTDTSEKNIGNVVKKISWTVLAAIFLALSVIFFGYSVYKYYNAKKIGTEIGKTAGEATGKFMGSYHGITDGLAEGKEEGITKGLSAEDTEVDIGNKIQTVGNLEVLSASVVMHDLLEIGDKYKTLLAFYGDITFTVDLYKAELNSDGNSYEVVLPMPEATLRIDDKKSKQLASDMKHSWSGSNEDGYIATMNSIKQLTLNAEKSVSNYDVLRESAKDSAEKQVRFLIQSATKEEVVVNVRFEEKTQ